jgi:hypothetical protein
LRGFEIATSRPSAMSSSCSVFAAITDSAHHTLGVRDSALGVRKHVRVSLIEAAPALITDNLPTPNAEPRAP